MKDVSKAASLMGRKSAEARRKNWGKKEFIRRMREYERALRCYQAALANATEGGGKIYHPLGLVLEKLEQQMPGATPGRAAFRDHIRLITGASGGMMGASLFAADFERSWPDRGAAHRLHRGTRTCRSGLDAAERCGCKAPSSTLTTPAPSPPADSTPDRQSASSE